MGMVLTLGPPLRKAKPNHSKTIQSWGLVSTYTVALLIDRIFGSTF
jgi:hypothetical protein